MSKHYLFSVALAAALLSACSNDETVNNGKQQGFNEDGNGYISLSINLPSVNGKASRANGVFDDGDANEYAVKDATLLIFSGADEQSAKLSKAYPMNLSFNTNPAEQITSSAKITQKIESTTGAKTFAYVALNKGGVFSIDPDGTLKQNGQSLIGQPFKDFTTKITTDVDLTGNANGFFMTNAPVVNMPGGTKDPSLGTVTTLSDVTNNIYKTEAEAEAAVAADVYVERAVAKVTVSATKTEGETSIDKEPYKILGWMLDNTNKTTTPTRNFSTQSWLGLNSNSKSVTAPYRFAEEKAIKGEIYRTYWGEDINYSTDAKGQLTTNQTYKGLDLNTNAYCYENTFNVAYQNKDQTTRVIIAATFNGEKPFWTAKTTSDKIYKTKEEFQNYIKKQILELDIVKTWAKANLKDANTTLTGANVTLTLSTPTDGKITVESVKITGVDLKQSPEAFPEDEVKTYLAGDTFSYYEGGVAYYQARIKHFGDDLTPWDNGETPTPTSGNIYPMDNRDDNYLGRYGVVRNNWYKLNVSKIATIGSPTVPSISGTDGNTPDDDKDSYISVEINILPWAVRTQDVEL